MDSDKTIKHCMSTELYPRCTHDCEWCVFYDKNSSLLAEWQEEKKRYAAQYDELKQKGKIYGNKKVCS